VERLLNAGTGVYVNAYRLGRLREKRIHRWRRLSYRRRLHDGTCEAVRWRRFGSHFRFSSPDEGRYKLEMPERAAVSAISALLATAFLALQAMAPSCDRDNTWALPPQEIVAMRRYDLEQRIYRRRRLPLRWGTVTLVSGSIVRRVEYCRV
jgi:hypothetical protein